jgi:hypothetical protein
MKFALMLACLLLASCMTTAQDTTAWTDCYREAQIECSVGDPVIGLQRALELPARPNEDSLPLVSDLYAALDVRIQAQMDGLGGCIADTPAQVKAEGKTIRLVAELREVLATAPKRQDVAAFSQHLGSVARKLSERDATRAISRARQQATANLAEQDRLLGAARAHEKAGSYRRAIHFYEELIDSDKTGKIGRLVATEMQRVQEKCAAVTRARSLSEQGHQSEAYDLLVRVLGVSAADDVSLPWKIESFPAGARAKFADEDERVTPFVRESTWNERTRFTLTLDGYQARTLDVAHPADQSVRLVAVGEPTPK